VRWNARIRTRLVPTLRQVIDQAMYLDGTTRWTRSTDSSA
jgi:hypothetical protein